MDFGFDYRLICILRIIVAGICGIIIGLERKSRAKEAGIRTHCIVACASCLMMIISKYGFFDLQFSGDFKFDPSRMAQGIVTGVGFLGAGMIYFQRGTLIGLTTASGISIDDVVAEVSRFNGVVFPAHLDRASYSVLSVLGFMYPEMNFTCAEFTHKAYIPQYEEKHPLLKGMKHLRNSDAHCLENMVEASEEIDLPECTAKAVVDYILGK